MKIRVLHPKIVPIENGAWDSVGQGWRQIFGDFQQLGFSIEHHQFWISTPLDWARSFHHDSLEICFNFSGYGHIRARQKTLEFFPRSAGFYLAGTQIQEAVRAGGERHHFLTLELSRDFLRRQFGQRPGFLRPIFQRFLDGEKLEEDLSLATLPLTTLLETISRSLTQPPVARAAWPLWFESKIAELLCEIAFTESQEKFCTRYHRVSRERVEQVISILRENLCEPPCLAEIGRLAGCSPFHLSRIFSAETGRTIPQYLRQLRMERAAELLRAGKHNVTEAAFAVGYASLSHFSKSFAGVFGHLPKEGGKRRLAV